MFLINAVYIGGDPLAQHENLNPGKVRTWAAGSDNITVGEANGQNNENNSYKWIYK